MVAMPAGGVSTGEVIVKLCAQLAPVIANEPASTAQTSIVLFITRVS
jgi:hypothetical protein